MKWILALAGVAAVAVIGAGAVMAQTPGTGDGKTFLDRVAQKLGIDTPKLQNAIKDARNDEIDEAVQNGDLTQEQADALKQKLDQAPGDGEFGFGFGHMRGRGAFGKAFGFHMRDGAEKLAGFLGISQEQLRTELSADGATLASVAEAHGKSRDELKAFIKDATKATLDEAVKNGDITQEQADTALSTLDSHLDQMIDAQCGGMGEAMPFGGPGRGHHMGPNGPMGGPDDGTGMDGMMEGLSRS
jgi:polyhydroxyalkanoate synthesis regulator phasin